MLGTETIAEIKLDMDRLTLPSWVPKGPKHPGSTKQGKLHADQWRSFCTINLVITLVRLWGQEDYDSKEGRMLRNFLHLVSAVKYASLRIVDEESIHAYETHIYAYLQTLLELYPGTELVPNQHMALHFGRHLRQFGPTHSWRCLAFERFNYLLQQVETNNIPSLSFLAYLCFCADYFKAKWKKQCSPVSVSPNRFVLCSSLRNSQRNSTRWRSRFLKLLTAKCEGPIWLKISKGTLEMGSQL